ncbi:hypothetical protein, partial [Nostoc sp. CHAB 5715]|uniref:hypothetical protein n=1 Tax=Nostoc sp. CHAB 5715 TaxID=2780400 RepID=UPI001E411E3F
MFKSRTTSDFPGSAPAAIVRSIFRRWSVFSRQFPSRILILYPLNICGDLPPTNFNFTCHAYGCFPYN